MRSIFFILILSCYASLSWAQDSPMEEKKGIIPTMREKLNSTTSNVDHTTDTLKHKLSADTLKRSTDSLKHSKWNAHTANQKYDSVQQLLANQNKLTAITDTVTRRITKPIDKVKQGADNLEQKAENHVQGKLDSIEQKLNKPLDKVNSKISSIEKPAEQKVVGVNQRVDQKTEKLQTNIQQGFDKATDGNVKAPVQNLNGAGVNAQGQHAEIAGVDISNPDVSGVGVEMPSVGLPNESLKIPDANLNVDQLKEKANLNISEVDKVKNVKGEMGQVDSKLAEIEDYEKELQGLKKMDSASIDNATKRVEDKVANLEEMKAVSEQKQLLTKQQLEYNAMMQRYQDKKLLKDEIARKSRNVVNGKIDKLTHAFKEAQEKMAKAKKLNSNADKYKDGKIKRENEMASKPLYERLVPGITVLVYNRDVFTIDWGFQLGYKFSNRLLGGAGAVYRMGVSEKYASWAKSAGIYGYRTYGNFNIVKGFYVHGEFESLYINSAVNPQTQIEIGSQVAYSGYFGIGKRYDISKKIRGSAIILYRAEFEGDLPSMSKINLRIGFDLNTKKRTKLLKPNKN